jgi:large subunit ribosomal protein L28
VQRHLHLGSARPQLAPAISTNAIKSIDHRGGFDTFMLKAKATELSPKALELKRAIEKKTAKAGPEAAAS